MAENICKNIAIRRRNRLRHRNKSRVCSGAADGFVCPGRIGVAALLAAALLALSACAGGYKPPAPPATSASPSSAPPTERVVGPLSEEDARALATMNDRLKEYIELHIKLERSLPRLPKEATPQQIDSNQRALEKLMRDARADAK